VAAGDIERWTAGRVPRPGAPFIEGKLTLHAIPFLAQDDYDRLLWLCDVNFVRGEDSFVRAQWAGLPMAWHIYPQEAHAHRPKLAAFVARYAAALDPALAPKVGALFDAWNGQGDITLAWDAVEPNLQVWAVAARRWAAELAARTDLASTMVQQVENPL
jgi:uncharacterized repeat protein (TIGR03837 family)